MDRVRKYVTELQETLDMLPVQAIDRVAKVMHTARLQQQQIFIVGNGGSASTASHFVCDLAKNTRVEGVPHFRVMDIIDNSAVFSAYANDEGYENAFAQHLANFVRPGDVVIGISTSGNSLNVLRTVELGNEMKAQTIGFTGFDGGRLLALTSMNIHIDSSNIEQVEDIHLILCHMLTANLRHMAAESAGRDNGRQSSPVLRELP